MRALINHTWSQPCFLYKARAFPRSQGWPFFISRSLGNGRWLERTIGLISMLVQGWTWQFTSMANTSCFCLVASHWMRNCASSEQVCISPHKCSYSCICGLTCFMHARLHLLCLTFVWVCTRFDYIVLFFFPVNLNKFMDLCQEIHLWVNYYDKCVF